MNICEIITRTFPDTKRKNDELKINREQYLKNIDKIKAYAKAYRLKQKEKKCLQNENE